MSKPKVINPPLRIWLQVGDIDEDMNFGDVPDGEVSWCSDKQFDTDIEYRLVKTKRRKRSSVESENDAP